MYLGFFLFERFLRSLSTVKARCSELRYSDYLVVAIGLACTDLVHTQYNDYFVVTMIVMLLLFPW
jgi:hypothetical protein